MRRLRRSHGSGKSRRKVDWETARIGTDAATTMTDGLVGVGWARWPAGLTNFFTDPLAPIVLPPDATLVRTLVKAGAFVSADPTQNGFLTFGICPYESQEPDFLENGFFPPGSIPDPFYAGNDWIITVQFPVNVATAGVHFAYFNGMNDKEFESRAMRKLPAGTGLLMAWSWNTLEGSGESVAVSLAASCRLAIKVP